MKKLNQKGFSHLEALLIVVVLALIGGAGYYVLKNNKSKHSSQNTTTQQTQNKTPTQQLTLANNSVAFDMPATWEKSDVGCAKDSVIYGGQEYLESVALLPEEKLRTVYGDGTEFFHINVCVFKNKNNLSPMAWFEGDSNGGIGEGASTTNDETSNETINGFPAFYRKTKSINTTLHEEIDEVSYSIALSDKIILIRARTYEDRANLPGIGNFRKFEAPIRDFVHSIKKP
jgi:hypothetical protein